MWFGCVSLFPEIFRALECGVTGRAIEQGLMHIVPLNPRQFAKDRYQRVDDYPYGGGSGMVLMAEPLSNAIKVLARSAPVKPHVIYLSPQGQTFNQASAKILLEKKAIIMVSGRYEGVDERFLEKEIDEEWSVGDFILSGGELAAMVMIDVMARLIPGVVGDPQSVETDTFSNGLLKYPQYTKPVDFNGAQVPPVLLSGNHKEIERWRLKQSLGRTWLKKPELLKNQLLTKNEKAVLNEFIEEYSKKNSKN